MSWQQQQQQQHQHRLPRILSEGGQQESSSSSSSSETPSRISQMGPPSQSLTSLNFRQLAPLRSPNLPSSIHSSSYFTQQRNRSTSESVANDALRSLRHPLPPNLPEPPSAILSSSKRGEVLPPLAAFGQTTSPNVPILAGESSGRSAKQQSSTQSSHYHPYQQYQHHQQQTAYPSSMQSSIYRSPPSNFNKNPLSPRGYYAPTMSPRSYHNTPTNDRHYYSPGSSSNIYDRSLDGSRESSLLEGDDSNSRKLAKSHVPSACLNCKRAHLACDVSRPCRRCINLGKTDTCIDVQHKKRGRPRLRDREAAAVAAAAAAAAAASAVAAGKPELSSGLPDHRMRGSISSTSSTSTMKQSPRSEPTAFMLSGGEHSLFSPSRLKASSSISSMDSRGRSVSSSASLWSQDVRAIANANEFSTSEVPPTVSLILSTGLQCARCSVESHALLGFSPTDLLERSLFELVHQSEKQRLEQLWLSLIEPVGVKPQVVPANAETVMTLSPSLLMAPAPGTVFMQETMRLRQRSGIFDFYSIRLHLGGGFGADLYQPHTLDRAYIVASLLKLGNDATHPDPNVLREARWDLGSDPRHFVTPQTINNSSGGGPNAQSSGVVGAAFHRNQHPSGGPAHYSSPTATSRYDWQRLDNDNKPAIARPLDSIANHQQHQDQEREQEERIGISPPQYLRPSYHKDYHAALEHNDDSRQHREIQPRSAAHDMDITPPTTARTQRADIAQPTNNGRPGLASKKANSSSSNSTVIGSSFSYSSRSDHGGITC